jgi:ABC-type uncharacterized transport system involved in gliding motility auxiliary subunit
MAVVAVAVGLRFQPWRPELQAYARMAAGAGLVIVLAYMFLAGQLSPRRQTRLGTIAAGSVLVGLGLLVAINYLSSRRNHRWDLTANKQFSLSDQTKQILTKLDAPVKILVFDKPMQFEGFRDRLDDYEYQSNRRLTVEYIDIDKQPLLANQNQVQTPGTVVFQYKGRTERVTSTDEQQLTNGLIKIITGAQKKIYFVQGHGEKDTANNDRTGYGAVASALGSENFLVDSLVLLQQAEVPADASVVVIAGPKTDLAGPEIDALKRYLDRGGKLLALVDPPDRPGVPPLTNLLAFLKDWSFDVGNNVIIDVSAAGQLLGTDEWVPVAARYPSHPIVERFRVATAYPLSRSVTPVAGGTNGRTSQSFVESSAQSWAETNLDELFKSQKVENDKDKDPQGPISISAALAMPASNPPKPAAPAADASKAAEPAKDASKKDEAPKPETRVVVMGDSDFACNAILGFQGNRDMFMNVMSWLAQQEDLIAIRPREANDRRITMTRQQQIVVTAAAILGIPALVFGAGIVTWSRRRKK